MIVQVQSVPKMKLSFNDQSDQVRFIIKAKQDNNMTNIIGIVYTENDT